MTATKPDVDLTDGAFYAGDSRSVYKWMRENEPGHPGRRRCDRFR
jgi:cholest-4-en-3-one 26-monooxygenase